MITNIELEFMSKNFKSYLPWIITIIVCLVAIWWVRVERMKVSMDKNESTIDSLKIEISKEESLVDSFSNMVDSLNSIIGKKEQEVIYLKGHRTIIRESKVEALKRIDNMEISELLDILRENINEYEETGFNSPMFI